MDSILTSIKKLLGIEEEYEHFDTDITIYINSVFEILNQIGVGPEETFRITSKNETWSDFFGEKNQNDEVKTFTYMKVRMIFDPPTGNAKQAMDELLKEMEWRLFCQYDPMSLTKKEIEQ